MDAWGDSVLSLAYCRLSNLSDAEDIFQIVFLKFHERTKPFNDEEHLKAWLLNHRFLHAFG